MSQMAVECCRLRPWSNKTRRTAPSGGEQNMRRPRPDTDPQSAEQAGFFHTLMVEFLHPRIQTCTGARRGLCMYMEGLYHF